MPEIYFWQQIISPHMAVLAAALARQGARVTYVAQRTMSTERARQGWQAPDLPGVDVRLAATTADVQALVAQAPKEAMHVCQGIRGNGMVRVAQGALAARGCPFWVTMETVEDVGTRGLVKRAVYRWLFWRWRKHVQGVLAIGRNTPAWLAGLAVPAIKIFPFTYFLTDAVPALPAAEAGAGNPVSILFVGQLIERKRVDLLIAALASIAGAQRPFVLQIIGAGPLDAALRAQAGEQLGQRVQWLGPLPMPEVRQRMAMADCLVLPSRHDGWGAVVSEALMAGTPAICSDRCGAAEAVLASGVGGVFQSGDQKALEALLAAHIAQGRQTVTKRAELAQWARSLGAEAGARYLLDIFSCQDKEGVRPEPPWRRGSGATRDEAV